ncbi:5'-methylthioadenosine/S-adenosylhomocysteine nucleosidase family protein [Streptomyces sp. NBC_00453]|uniref:5'-methylthioadenosine/S-adenosylhomocysteine nucleosidase family protein n=1 Tax=Streptomyces sp. NBC_00453 TaxID=2903653 RepID=UPI002E249D22
MDSLETADVAILTALREEHAAVLEALGDYSEHRWRGHVLAVGTVGDLRVLAFPMGGMGNAGSAQSTALVISVWNPAYIVVTGIAGGDSHTSSDLQLGDVLIPDQVIGYEAGKIVHGKLERRYEVYRPDHELLQTARALAPESWALASALLRPDRKGNRTLPRAHFGPVFSGEKILADSNILHSLKEHWPKAVGIEMESLGVALAAHRGGPGFFMAKAVSDFADSNKNDNWRAYAARNAAHFSIATLRASSVTVSGNRRQAVPVGMPSKYAGATKIYVCQRLHFEWMDLADYFEVPLSVKARFEKGNEPRNLWEWLELRGKLPLLPDALSQYGRGDLAQFMQENAT